MNARYVYNSLSNSLISLENKWGVKIPATFRDQEITLTGVGFFFLDVNESPNRL